MSLVIRDFAPLDSVIQVDGRCNRNADRSSETVKLVRLKKKNGKQFCGIYDEILLQTTTVILNERQAPNDESRVPEKEVSKLSQQYFDRLRQDNDLGARYTGVLLAGRKSHPFANYYDCKAIKSRLL